MTCIESKKFEAWLSGENPTGLDSTALLHLRTCPNCLQNLRIALALKASAAVPAIGFVAGSALLCSKEIDSETRLSYLDNLMPADERTAYEGHLGACQACRRALLEFEYEIADVEMSEVEVPAELLAKARSIGEAECARHEPTSWRVLVGNKLSAWVARGLQPQWAAALALIIIVAVATFYYYPSRQKISSTQQAHVKLEATSPSSRVERTPPLPPPVTTAKEPDSALVARVQNVLEQVARAADGPWRREIRLRITDSKEYIAQVSPQGELTLSTQYIAATQNDDELAFLLAHELSHGQHPANCILSFSTSSGQAPSMLNSPEQKRVELQADRMGVYLASVAGYHADAAESLLGRIRNIPNISDAAHPGFNARLRESAEEVHSIARAVELFRVGVSFFNTEQYSRAVAVFEMVAREFPSREAFNDLGLSYHKLALEYSSQNWGFKKSVILDPVARAIEPVREDLPEANLFSEFLTKAIEQYRRAIARDPSYIAVRINLASALDDQGDYSAAVKELEGLDRMNAPVEERAKVLNNLGVIAAKQSRLGEAAMLLERAVGTDVTFSDPHFNLARVRELEHDTQAATEEYARYAQLAGKEHDGWLRMAYNKLNKPWLGTGPEASGNLPKLGNIQLGESLGRVEREMGQPTTTWNLKTPTQFEFFVTLFETRGLVISGSEGVIDFVQTASRYPGTDTANHLSEGMTRGELDPKLREAIRISLPGSRESYIDFERGLGINLRGQRVDAWYIFEPIV